MRVRCSIRRAVAAPPPGTAAVRTISVRSSAARVAAAEATGTGPPRSTGSTAGPRTSTRVAGSPSPSTTTAVPTSATLVLLKAWPRMMLRMMRHTHTTVRMMAMAEINSASTSETTVITAMSLT